MQPQILFVICAKHQPLDRAHTGMTFSGNLCADSYETRRHLRLLDTPLRHIRDLSLLICCFFFLVFIITVCAKQRRTFLTMTPRISPLSQRAKTALMSPLAHHLIFSPYRCSWNSGLMLYKDLVCLHFPFALCLQLENAMVRKMSAHDTMACYGKNQMVLSDMNPRPQNLPKHQKWWTVQSLLLVLRPIPGVLIWNHTRICTGASLPVSFLRCASNGSGEPWQYIFFLSE